MMIRQQRYATRRFAWVLFFLSAVIIVLLLSRRLCEILFYTLRFPAEKLQPWRQVLSGTSHCFWYSRKCDTNRSSDTNQPQMGYRFRTFRMVLIQMFCFTIWAHCEWYYCYIPFLGIKLDRCVILTTLVDRDPYLTKEWNKGDFLTLWASCGLK